MAMLLAAQLAGSLARTLADRLLFVLLFRRRPLACLSLRPIAAAFQVAPGGSQIAGSLLMRINSQRPVKSPVAAAACALLLFVLQP